MLAKQKPLWSDWSIFCPSPTKQQHYDGKITISVIFACFYQGNSVMGGIQDEIYMGVPKVIFREGLFWWWECVHISYSFVFQLSFVAWNKWKLACAAASQCFFLACWNSVLLSRFLHHSHDWKVWPTCNLQVILTKAVFMFSFYSFCFLIKFSHLFLSYSISNNFSSLWVFQL